MARKLSKFQWREGWGAAQAFEDGMTEAQLHEYTKIDPWFLAQLGELHQAETWLRSQSLDALSTADLVQVKRRGFSDPQIAKAVGAPACPPSSPPSGRSVTVEKLRPSLRGRPGPDQASRFSNPQIAKAVGEPARSPRLPPPPSRT